MKKFKVQVFGKAGCDKCKVLNKRLDALLEKPEWQDFEKVYCDVETEDGLVDFCNVECINPQRIPAFAIKGFDAASGKHVLARSAKPGQPDPICKGTRLYTYIGLQTDYTAGDGVISPKMLTAVLGEARQAFA